MGKNKRKQETVLETFARVVVSKSHLLWPAPVVLYALYIKWQVNSANIYTVHEVIQQNFPPFLLFLAIALVMMIWCFVKYSKKQAKKMLLLCELLITSVILVVSGILYYNFRPF